MDYEKICDEVLNCDNQIRYVGVYDYCKLYDKMQIEVKNYLAIEDFPLWITIFGPIGI